MKKGKKLQCGTCGLSTDSTEWLESRELFNKHLGNIKPPLNKEFSISLINELSEERIERVYRVNYALGFNEKFNLIYTIIENNNDFKFRGMFMVP